MDSLSRRSFLVGSLSLSTLAMLPEVPLGASTKPVALVYAGPASQDETNCWEPIVTLLKKTYDVKQCGPLSTPKLKITAELLSKASLYVQPGGGQDLEGAWNEVKVFRPKLMKFLEDGGHYVGICMGAYLAAGDNNPATNDQNWGLALYNQGPAGKANPGDVEVYAGYSVATDAKPGDTSAELLKDVDKIVEVTWNRSGQRNIYHQGGPDFTTILPDPQTKVLARYDPALHTSDAKGLIAAMVVPVGRGSVGICGPHPEAPNDWYQEGKSSTTVATDFTKYLPNPSAAFPNQDLFYNLVSETVAMKKA